MQVVFTGPAKINGQHVLRVDITDAASKAGCVIRGKIEPGVDVLVASRDDTVKAKNAAKLGVEVMTYDEFAGILGKLGVAIVCSGAEPDPYVDLDHHVPDFTNDTYGNLL